MDMLLDVQDSTQTNVGEAIDAAPSVRLAW
jgi:hypothetical protein